MVGPPVSKDPVPKVTAQYILTWSLAIYFDLVFGNIF